MIFNQFISICIALLLPLIFLEFSYMPALKNDIIFDDGINVFEFKIFMFDLTELKREQQKKKRCLKLVQHTRRLIYLFPSC